MKYYRLRYDNHANFKVIIRKLLLIGALVADFFAICSIIEIAVEGALYALKLVGLIALSTVLRVISMLLLVTYDYKFCGEAFTITVSNALTSKTAVKLDKNTEYTIQKFEPNASLGKYTNLCGNCTESKYLLKTGEKTYFIALDEYMLALIQNIKDK